MEYGFENFLWSYDNALRLELMADVPPPFYDKLMKAVEKYKEVKLTS